MKYEMLFHPVRPVNEEGTFEDAVLIPVIVNEDGRKFAAQTSAVTTVEKALSMSRGFELAQMIEQAGGFDAVEAITQEDDPDAA